jgi:acyl-coenzyme A synthetase/AMP-(fatty) acid ligase
MGLWHAHGQGFYWATQLAGCETNFISVKDIRKMSEYRPTFITAIPDILKPVHNLNFNNLRFIRSASAPMPSDLYNSLKNKFNIPVIEAFGMTEALSHCFTNPLHGEQRIGTVGLPDGVEAKIVDGKLFLKGPTMFVPGWYDTGDLAEQDECGYYKIVGRSKDQINVRGVKLNPLSLEKQIINAIPTLTECVVFGDSEVKCLYVGDSSAAEIMQVLSNIGQYCKPALVKSVDSIPLSPSGKISRSFLNNVYH